MGVWGGQILVDANILVVRQLHININAQDVSGEMESDIRKKVRHCDG